MNSIETLCTKNDQLALQVEYVKKTNVKDIYLKENKRERERENEREGEREGGAMRGRWRAIKLCIYLHNIKYIPTYMRLTLYPLLVKVNSCHLLILIIIVKYNNAVLCLFSACYACVNPLRHQ